MQVKRLRDFTDRDHAFTNGKQHVKFLERKRRQKMVKSEENRYVECLKR